MNLPIIAPLLAWWQRRCADALRGTLVDIFIAEAAGAAMDRVERIEAVAGVGLAGDRYATARGYWKRTDACQVTLITEADLRRAERRSGLSFAAGEHRRNLVVRGLALDAFTRRPVRIGEVLFAFERPRPPCGYLERLVGRGAAKGLAKGAGICLKVVEGGTVRVGDAVAIVTDSPGQAPHDVRR